MKKVPTGVDGLDKMLNGGLPSQRSILICGSPGAGKTILSWQFLYNGAVHYNEPGLYISLDEDTEELREEISSLRWDKSERSIKNGTTRLGWDIERLEKERKVAIVDASPIRLVPGEVQIGNIRVGKRDFNLVSLIEIMKQKADQIKAKRLVIDPITTLTLQYDNSSDRRTAILDLFQALKKMGTTNLITTELKKVIMERDIHMEEYLAHGVIVLYTFFNVEDGKTFRSMRIEKMRGIAHDNQVRPYEISSNGFVVFPQEQLIGTHAMIANSQLQM